MGQVDLNISKLLDTDSGSMNLDIECSIPQNQFVILYGGSGTGKTTILRTIAGLLIPEQGNIEVSGRKWLDTKESFSLPVHKRSVGYVFQDQALF
ncbi:MAG: ATP-binding cassette domain-containing protein, partial [Flavobacteriales bacterium]